MTYSEFEFWAGSSLKVKLLKWCDVGFIEVTNITNYQ